MTPHHQRDYDSFVFTAKTPHFFKIILDDTLRDGKLGIPRTFVRQYGNGLPNPLLLKVPSGAVWQVELTKCDGDVWLQNGWQEFAEYYSLAHGHLLVFRYENNSHFSVVIFDTSASEIGYPYTITHKEEYSDSDEEFQEPKMDETKDNISIEILEGILPCPKRREKSPLPYPLPHKLMRTNSTNKTDRTSKLQNFSSTHSSGEELEDFMRKIDTSQCSTQELGGGEGTSTARRGSQSKILGRMQPLTTSGKAQHLQRASAFKSDNPFFMVTMQSSYIHLGCGLNIPAAFARKYFIEEQGDVILYISDGRTWSAKYQRGTSNCYPHVKLSGGWKAFAQDNHLEVGDVCVFELMKGNEFSLKVVIFRLVEDANCHLSPADENGANRVEHKQSPVINIKSDCTSDHANGVPSLHRHNSTKNFQVPKIEEIENDVSVEILDDFTQSSNTLEKSPSPYLQSRKKRETNPSGNSERISKAQTLAPPCSPEGIQSKGLKLQKSKKNLNLPNSTKKFGAKEEGGGGISTVQKCPRSKFLGRILPLTPKEKARAVQRASTFKSENPFFVVAMQPSYIQPGCKLDIPFKFSKLINQIGEQYVTLEVADRPDRPWPVKLISYPYICKGNLTSGWCVFALENSLRMGDVCVFELIKRDDAVLKVTIFRGDG